MRSPSRALLLAVVVAGVLTAGAGPALAAETANSEFLIIQPDDILEDDLYAGAIKADVQGTIDGDLVVFAAEEVVIDGLVTGSVTAVAPRVIVNGRIGGALRVTASSLRVGGEVGRDVVVAAVEVQLGADSSVARDVQAWAFDMAAEGRIGRNLAGNMGALALAGTVEGDVEVSVGRLRVVDDLSVGGDFGYNSSVEAEGLDLAEVGGVVVRERPLPPNIRVRALGLFGRFLVVLFLTLTAVGVAYGWPDRTKRAVDRLSSGRVKAWGAGAVVMLSPVVIVALAALLVTLAPSTASLPLLAVMAPVILAAFGIVFALALVAGVPAAGKLGASLFRNLDFYGSMLAGAIVVGLAWLIPWVGWLVPLVVLPLGLGGWLLSWREPAEDQT